MNPSHNTGMGSIPMGNMLLLLTAIVGGVLFSRQAPLKSLRPEMDHNGIHDPAETSIPSRLWEDPFEIMERWENSKKAAPPQYAITGTNMPIGGETTDSSFSGTVLPITPSPSQAHSICKIDKIVFTNSNTLVIPVMMDTAHYPEASEVRVQQRYAILSALNVAGYERVDQKNIQIGSLKIGGTDSAPGDYIEAPYEDFTPTFIGTDPLLRGVTNQFTHAQPNSMNKTSWDHIRVVWIDAKFAKNKKALLGQYIALASGIRSHNQSNVTNVHVRILGPRDSDQINLILKEYHSQAENLAKNKWKNLQENPLDKNGSKETGEEIKPPEKYSYYRIYKILSRRELLPIKDLSEKKEFYDKVMEDGKNMDGRPEYGNHKFDLFSNWATADYKLLLHAEELSNKTMSHPFSEIVGKLMGLEKEEEKLKKWIGDNEELRKNWNQLNYTREELLLLWGVYFNRTIGLDDRVVGALLDELKKRHAFPKKGKDQIILLGEWDSTFSRALSLTFATEYYLRVMDKENPPEKHSWPQNIKVFSYLRGIDGLLPAGKHYEMERLDGRGKGNSFTSSLSRLPQGTSQYDYLRRLALRIKRLEKKEGKIKAVGIFGSDPYDKLLILRAMRDLFPETVFFTTDLDARYAHYSELKWTRNLIVGSSYGLELHPKLQKSTPPFRNSYQTATYATMLSVVKGTEWVFDIDKYDPRIFEIGKNGPFDLSPTSSCQDAEWTNSERLILHPPNMNQRKDHLGFISTVIILGMIAPILLLVFWGYCCGRREYRGLIVKKHLKGRFRRYLVRFGIRMLLLKFIMMLFGRGKQGCGRLGRYWVRFACIGLGLSVLLFGVIMLEEGSVAEPRALFDGISIWPTLLIRCLLLMLSLYFIIRGGFSIHSDYLRIPKVFNFDEKKYKCGLLKKESFIWPFNKDGNSYSSIDQLWADYSYRRFVRSDYRLLVWISCFCVSLITLWLLCRSALFVPARGSFTFAAYVIFSQLSLSMMFALCGITFYSLFRSSRFISHVYYYKEGVYKSCNWSEEKFQSQVLQKSLLSQMSIQKIHLMKESDPQTHLKNIQLVGRITETTGRMIISPFIALSLLIFSGSNDFDALVWSPVGVGFIGITVFVALIAAVDLRIRARTLRRHALAALKQLYFQADKERSDLLEKYIDEVKEYDRGAFSPLASNPVLLAILTPFGGYGVIAIIQSFMSSM